MVCQWFPVPCNTVQHKVNMSEVQDEAIDPYDLLDAVEIVSKIPKDFYEKVEEKKWQERREALEAVQKLTDLPKIENGDFHDLVKALKKVITKDSNVMLVIIAAKCVTGLARGTRKKFSTHAPGCIDAILEKFKEKKLSVVVVLREAIDAVFLTTTFEPILEDVVAALDNKNPSIKTEVASFLSRAFARSTMASLPKKQLKVFCKSLCKTISDTAPDVRDASFNALGIAMKVVGEKPMQPYLADTDNLKLAKIKEYYDKAVLLNAQGEPRSGSSAPAPSAAKANEPKPVKRPPPTAAAAKPQAAPAGAGAKTGKAKSAVAGKGKGAAKKGAAVKEEVTEIILSDEDVEVKAGSVIPAETLAQLDNANWKERLAGMEKFTEIVQGLDKSEIPAQALVRVINKKPGLKDTNFQVLRLRIDLITLLAQKSTFTSRSAEFCICALVDKIGDGKNGSVVQEALTAIAEATSLDSVSQEVVRLAFAQKNPKNQSESLNWLSQAVKDFGMKITVKLMITSIKTAFSATNPAIRTSAITLLGVIYMYMGPQLRMFFEDEKPALLQQIDAAFEKVKGEKPPPATRGLRAQETDGEGEDRAESDAEDNTPAINLQDLIPRTDISEKITEELITELGDKNWKVRNEGLLKVTAYINEAKFITCNIGQLPEAMKARLSDSNKILVMTSLTICQSMATAMGPNCKTHVRTIGPALLICTGDGKPQVRAAAIATLNIWVEQCTLLPFVENEILMDALKIENPNLRTELFGWLSERLPDHKQLPAADLRLCVPNLLACLEDRNVDVRKKSQEALVPFMIHIGYESVHKAAGKLKPASKDVVMPILEKVKGNIPVKAVKAPVKKSAPVAKATTSSVPSKGPPSVDSDEDSPTGKDPRPKTAPAAAKKAPAKGKAPPPAGSKKKKGDEDTGPAICVTVSREQRIKDEKNMKILKWNFTDPRLEFVEQLKGQMDKNFSKSLIDLLFKNDFKCHIKAIEVLTKCLDTYPEETVSNLDLILRWATLRFFDTNPSMLNKALEYLVFLFGHLADTDYHLSELDANSFIPYLLGKVGDSKENVRRHVRSILKLLCKLFPSSKMFGFVLDGLKSKNAKQRSECLDELGSLIEVYGINVCQPSPQQALKLITQQIGDRDNTVRNAALNCIVSAYTIMGEGLYKIIGGLNDKEQSLLDERIKRSNKNRPASAPPPQGNRIPLQKATQNQPNENTVSHRSPTKTSPTKGEYTLAIEGLDLKPCEQPKLYDWIPKFDELMKLPPIELPERRTPRVPRSTFIKMLGTATDTNTPITHVISQIPSADTNLCLGALAQIDEVLKDDEKSEMLISHVDHLLMMAVMQLRTLHNKHMSEIDMPKETLFKLYRCILATLLAVFQHPNLSRHASQGVLKDVISCFVSLLLDTRLESYEQGEQIIQTVNIMVAKVLKTSNPAYVIGASIQLIQENVTQPGQGTKALELCMRCVWRLIKLLPDVINDLQVDRVLLDCHNFLTEFPSSTWKNNMDKPLRTIKTILYTLFKLQGDKLIRQTGLINDPNAEIMQYLRKLQSQAPGDRTKGYSDIEVDENQPPPKENKRSGNKLPEGAQDTLMEIFKNIGRRETMKEGLNDLYDFKEKHPEHDLNLYLKHSSQYFRDYLDRHLTIIKQEREGTRPATDAGKTGSSVENTSSVAPNSMAYLQDSKVMDNYIDEVVQSSAQWRNRLDEFMQKYVPVDESGNSVPVASTPAGRKTDPDIILSHSPIIPSSEVDVTDQSSDHPPSDPGSNGDENEAQPSQTASLADLKKRLERIKNMAHS